MKLKALPWNTWQEVALHSQVPKGRVSYFTETRSREQLGYGDTAQKISPHGSQIWCPAILGGQSSWSQSHKCMAGVGASPTSPWSLTSLSLLHVHQAQAVRGERPLRPELWPQRVNDGHISSWTCKDPYDLTRWTQWKERALQTLRTVWHVFKCDLRLSNFDWWRSHLN